MNDRALDLLNRYSFNPLVGNGAYLGLNGIYDFKESPFDFGLSSDTPAAPTDASVFDSFDWDSLNLNLSATDMYPTSVVNNINFIPYPKNSGVTGAGDISGLLASAQKGQFTGAVLRTAGAAESLFNSLINFGATRSEIKMTAANQKQAYKNQMAALDNQVAYVKNQLADRFNKIVAMNTVNMAARNLKVSAGTLLEQSKETAHDINMDYRTLESNAELQKISLRNSIAQTDVWAKAQKNKQWTDLVGGAANLGLAVATGGGTMQSWGDLWGGYKAATGSLNKSVYGG